jgi:O-antigen/teichoic acid export membrane protein
MTEPVSSPPNPSARRGARWVAVSQATRLGVQVIGLLILSRLLRPSDFGLVAMASIVAYFANLLRDLGTGAALIQKQDLKDDTILAVFWLNCGIGVALAVLVALCSPLIAIAFKAPALVPLLIVLSLSFPIASAGIVHQSMLERASKFATVARIEIVSFLTALVVAVGSALAGAGAYSLILQTLAAAILGTVQLWMCSGWRPKLRWPYAELKGLLGFSSNLFAFGFVNYFARNADTMVIGRFLDAASLGAYSLAYRIMLFPLQNLTVVATRVLYPIFSRQQSAPREMAALYLRTLSVIAYITAPLMAGLFALREPFVSVVLGAKWADAIPVIAWLAPCGFIQSLVSTSGCVFMAKGRTDQMFRLGVAATVVQVTGFAIGIRWGVVGVAACYLVANALCALPVMYFALRLVGQTLGGFLAAIRLPVLLAIAMAAVVSGVRTLISDYLGSESLELATLILLGVACYAAASHLAARKVEEDVWRLLVSRA